MSSSERTGRAVHNWLLNALTRREPEEGSELTETDSQSDVDADDTTMVPLTRIYGDVVDGQYMRIPVFPVGPCPGFALAPR